jgi:hypothetical protein
MDRSVMTALTQPEQESRRLELIHFKESLTEENL